MSIKRISSRNVYRNDWMNLRVDKVELADGSQSEYGVIERASFILVIATQGSSLLLVRQYRYPIDSWTWEFPQGACDIHESTEQAARRELLEETGYVAGDMKMLSTLYEAAGFATHNFQVVEAEVVKMLEPSHEVSEEGMTSHWIELDDLKNMVLGGVMQDAPSLAALSIYLLKRL